MDRRLAADIDRARQCPVTNQEYSGDFGTTPLVTPCCGHTLTRDALKQIADAEVEECPLCGSMSVTAALVALCPRNLALLNALQLLRRTAAKLDSAASAFRRLESDHVALQSAHGALRREAAALRAQQDAAGAPWNPSQVVEERDSLRNDLHSLNSEHGALQDRCSVLRADRDEAASLHATLQLQRNDLEAELTAVAAQRDALLQQSMRPQSVSKDAGGGALRVDSCETSAVWVQGQHADSGRQLIQQSSHRATGSVSSCHTPPPIMAAVTL